MEQVVQSAPASLGGARPAGVTRSWPARHPLPLAQRIRVQDAVVRRVRAFLEAEAYERVPALEAAHGAGSSEVIDAVLHQDYAGSLAFPRQAGPLYLAGVVAGGAQGVYCEGEGLRGQGKTGVHHLTESMLIHMGARDLSLDELCDFQERLLKSVAVGLDAEIVGGPNATRIDRMARSTHPRITYREALAILNRRGFTLAFGDALDRAAEAALVHHCGNLPLQITRYPEGLGFFHMKIDRRDPAVVECVDSILPFAGETLAGSVRESDIEILGRRLRGGTMHAHLMRRARELACRRSSEQPAEDRDEICGAFTRMYVAGIERAFAGYLGLFAERSFERAGCTLAVARLIQYVLGLDSIQDAVPSPPGRTRREALGQTFEVDALS